MCLNAGGGGGGRGSDAPISCPDSSGSFGYDPSVRVKWVKFVGKHRPDFKVLNKNIRYLHGTHTKAINDE